MKTPERGSKPTSALDIAARLAARLLPSALTPAIDQARRDAAMLVSSLAGRSPSPLVKRRPRPVAVAAAPAPGLHSRTLRVERVVRETADAVTLVLGDPTGAPITFLPGQFFTVLEMVQGQQLRRAYSASCAPGAEGPSRVSLTIKRVPGGRVSNHLNDTAAQGLSLEVLGPSGAFTPEPSDGGPRHLVLLAGGSGITPLMSIARTVLATEPATHVSLVYGNRREADIIFRDALASLARERPGRFVLRHVLSEPPLGWEGGAGMMDRHRVEEELSALPIYPEEPATYFVCGPEPMMQEARAALLARGIAPERIREERFSQPHLRPNVQGVSGPQPVKVHLRGVARELTVPAGATVLEAALSAGLPMPYSCAMGGCGACKVTLRTGEVRMEEPNCLTAEERARGQVLACVSRPVTPVTVDVP